jgi:ABC-2 type transport system permease protein
MSRSRELAAGVIHDIGYGRYEGPRLGRLHSVGALYAHSLRAVFGLRRSARYRVLPFLLFALVCLPAVVFAALVALSPVHPPAYPRYPFYVQVLVMIFVAAQAPQLVTTDLRHRTLTLYWSRPLRRGDYVWAKLAALATGLFVLLGTPVLLMSLAALLSQTHAPGDALAEAGRLLTGLGAVAVDSAVLAAMGVAISAFNRVRPFAIVGVIGVYLVTSTVVLIVQGVLRGTDVAAVFGLLSPFTLLDGFQVWALGGQPAGLGTGRIGWAYGLATVAALAGAAGVLQLRYRRLSA